MRKFFIRLSAFFMTICLLVTAMPIVSNAAQNTFDPDNGVYDISSVEDFIKFKDSMDAGNYYDGKTICLNNDLDFSGYGNYVSPNNFELGTEFHGTFCGNEHTIKNIVMVASDGYSVGLFPVLNEGIIKDLTLENAKIVDGECFNGAFVPVTCGNATVKNCRLAGESIVQSKSTINARTYCAGIIGEHQEGTLIIENCAVESGVVINSCGSETSPNYTYIAAGILGALSSYDEGVSAEITGCINETEILSDDVAAGIVGTTHLFDEKWQNSLKISNCHNFGSIRTNKSPSQIGTQISAGILALSQPFAITYIDNCSNSGDITVKGDTANASGGIVGEANYCQISNTYNTGKITSEERCVNGLGGIIGHINSNSLFERDSYPKWLYPVQYNMLLNCYNTGDVDGRESDYVGGICANIQEHATQAKHTFIANCYSCGNVTGNKLVSQGLGYLYNFEFENIFTKKDQTAIYSYTVQSSDHENSENVIYETAYLNPQDFESEYGVFDSTVIDSKVYPATITPSGKEGATDIYHEGSNTISDMPLDTDLKRTLDKYVDNTKEFTWHGNSVKLLPWTYSDGSDGLDIHPVFGYDIENLDPESDKAANGGYLTTSKYGYEYYKPLSDDDKTVSITVNPNSGSTLKSLAVKDQNGGDVAITKVNDATYTFDMPESDVTVDAEWESGNQPNNTVYLTTKDSVDINFVVDADYYLPNEDDKQEAYVELNYNHNPITYKTDFQTTTKQLKDVEKTDDGRYRFTIESAPAQLTESIKITLYNKAGDKLYDADYSMWEYCDDIIKNDIKIHETSADSEVIAKYDKAAEVCKALTDYATAAQIYFDYNTVDMSSKEVQARADALGSNYYTDADTAQKYFHDVCNVTKETIKADGGAVANVQGELPFAITETSLMSLSNTEVRFYYEEDVDTADYELSVTGDNWYGGKAPSVSFGEANSGKFVQVKGIESANLDNVLHVTIRQKSTGKTATVNYNALAYCYTVLRGTEGASDAKQKQLRSMVKSVYLYNRYAQEYFVD